MTGLSKTGGLYIRDNSTLDMKNVLFLKNYGKIASDIQINNCEQINIYNMTLLYKHNILIMQIEITYYVNLTKITIKGSLSYTSKFMPKNVILLGNLYILTIKDCLFKGLNSQSSPIQVFFVSSQFKNNEILNELYTITIDSTRFYNCSSQTIGGALYLDPYFFTIINNCDFLSNFAINTGGAIFFSNPTI